MIVRFVNKMNEFWKKNLSIGINPYNGGEGYWKGASWMLNPFINAGLEIVLKELYSDNVTTEQVYPTTDIRKERLIVYVYPDSLKFVFVDQEQEALD